MEKSQKFVEAVLGYMTTQPFTVKATTDEMGVLLTLQVHQSDMGKIIGKEGANAKALRTLLRVVGMSENARVNLKIEEPEGSTYRREPRQNDAEMLAR